MYWIVCICGMRTGSCEGLLIVTVVFFLIGLIWCGFVYVGGFLLFFDFVFVKSRSMKNGDREDDVEDGSEGFGWFGIWKGEIIFSYCIVVLISTSSIEIEARVEDYNTIA